MTDAALRPFALLDRDGTLIEDRGYAHQPSDCVPLPGAHAAVARLRGAGFGVVVLTNQSGIGRGRFSGDAYTRFEAQLLRDFADHAAPLDGCYHCPHLPDAGCDCRKPAPGLALRAAREHGIDLARSWVIGDKGSDIALAHAIGARAVLVQTGEGAAWTARVPAGTPVARDLLDAVTRFVLPARSAQSER